MTEQEIEQALIEKLGDLKYAYRPDIRDRATLEANFRQHFEALIPMPLPRLPEEQQKIADCLASIDDHITAQTQKLAALKAHKKGLLQQLFPVLDEVAA